jgi:hypothetical protein
MENIENLPKCSFPTGISDTQLASQTNVEELSCPICLSLCFRPILLKCCQKLICSECIRELIKTHNTCPSCKAPGLDFEMPPKLINRMYENITLKCSNFGCSETMKYYFYMDHVYNICTFKPNTCQMSFCKLCEHIYKLGEALGHVCGEGRKKKNKMNNVEKRLDILLYPDKQREMQQEEYTNTHVHPHKLSYVKLNNYSWTCDLCEAYNTNKNVGSFRCSQCNFDLCDECVSRIAGNRCKKNLHNHGLLIKDSGHWICDVCDEEHKNSMAWNCSLCDFDICVNCYWS